jgi:TRAP-type mannitol/chloroaromatic compound transport system substrate-binding protein
MERRSFLQGAGMAGILASGIAPAFVRAQEPIRWRLASSFPKSLDTVYRGQRSPSPSMYPMPLAVIFVISVHPAGEIVPRRLAWWTPSSRARSSAPTRRLTTSLARTRPSRLDCSVPFGMTSRAMSAWMYRR